MIIARGETLAIAFNFYMKYVCMQVISLYLCIRNFENVV